MKKIFFLGLFVSLFFISGCFINNQMQKQQMIDYKFLIINADEETISTQFTIHCSHHDKALNRDIITVKDIETDFVWNYMNLTQNDSCSQYIWDYPNYYTNKRTIILPYQSEFNEKISMRDYKIADVNLYSEDKLKEGDNSLRYYIELKTGIYQHKYTCFKWSTNVIRVDLQDYPYITDVPQYLKSSVDSCYLTNRTLIDGYYEFNLNYKTFNLNENDYIKVIIVDEDINNDLLFLDNIGKEDLMFEIK